MSRFSFPLPRRLLATATAMAFAAQISLGIGSVAASEPVELQVMARRAAARATAPAVPAAPTPAPAAPVPAAPAPAVDTGLQAQLARALRDAAAHSAAPGMSMSVIAADGRQWSGADGWWRRSGEPVSIDTILPIGSVTKTFTAALAQALADEGRLQLDALVTTYLPNVALGRGATVRQLLNHTSGIADLYGPARAYLEGAPGTALSSNDVLRPVGGPWFAPGAGYAYSNTNYFLLGLIIEDITGRSINEELEARFTGPLGLERTRLVTAGDAELPAAWSTAFWTSGAMVSTPAELAAWGQALFGGDLLSDAAQRRMLDFSAGDDYGEGAQRFVVDGQDLPGHSGLLYDTTSLLVHLPAEGVTVAIIGTAPRTDLWASLTERRGGPSPLELARRLAG